MNFEFQVCKTNILKFFVLKYSSKIFQTMTKVKILGLSKRTYPKLVFIALFSSWLFCL